MANYQWHNAIATIACTGLYDWCSVIWYCAVSADLFLSRFYLRSSQRLFCHVSTMAMRRSRVYLLANFVGCSQSSTPLLGSYSVPGSSITQRHCSVNSTGFEFRSGSRSSWHPSSSGVSTAQHLRTLPTASIARLTSPRQQRSLFQWLVAARSGIVLSRLLLPAHGTAYHHSLRHRRHCRHSSGIWRRTCLPRHTDGAVSAFY